MAEEENQVKCLNDAGPTLKNAIPGSALPKAMDDVAVLIKGGTNAAEKIDPGTLAKLLQSLTPLLANRSYKITHFLDDTASLLSGYPTITGMFGKNSVIGIIESQAYSTTAVFKNLQGSPFHLKEAAIFTRAGGSSLVTKLEANPGHFLGHRHR